MRSPFLIATVVFSLLAPLAFAQAQAGEPAGRQVIIIPPSDAPTAPESQSTPASQSAGDSQATSDGTPPPKVIVVTPQTGQAAPTNVGQAGQRIIVVPPTDQLPQAENPDADQTRPPEAAKDDGAEGSAADGQRAGTQSTDETGSAPSTASEGSDQVTPGSRPTESISATPAEPDAPLAGEEGAEPGVDPSAPIAAALPAPEVPLIEGHPRYGPFLSGPGSLPFMMHHTLMGATGGLVTQGIPNNFRFDTGSREAMLAGTLVGAGAGFGVSAWWQFHHYVGKPAAYFGLVNSLVGGMAMTGLLDLTTDDSTALAWSSVIGAELGAWLTVGIGGGDFPVDDGLLISSGEGWGLIYGALTLAMVRFSGSTVNSSAAADTLLIAPGIGATLLAFAAGRFHPSRRQLMRANIAGAAIGGAVLLLSALVLGHLDIPTPYLLAMISSASSMAIVSIFWADPPAGPPGVRPGDSAQYRSLW